MPKKLNNSDFNSDCNYKVIYPKETQKRSIFKSILYRFLTLSFTIVLSYSFIGNFKKTIYFSIFAETLQTIIYYSYERFWNSINWGYSYDFK